jgi:hypothetical protein
MAAISLSIGKKLLALLLFLGIGCSFRCKLRPSEVRSGTLQVFGESG